MRSSRSVVKWVLTAVSLMGELLSDLCVGKAGGDEPEDVFLSCGEFVELLRSRRPPRAGEPEAEGCEDQDSGGVVSGEDPPGRLESVELGHPDVHQDHGSIKPPLLGYRFESISCLCHDFDVLLAGEQHPEPSPDHGLVVGDEDADLHG